MSEAAPLYPVPDEPGEDELRCTDCGAISTSPQLEHANAVIRSHEAKIRNLIKQMNDLRRDKDAEARADALWEQGERLFNVWRYASKHDGECARAIFGDRKPSRSAFSWERFELVRPFLAKHGYALCASAIIGRCFEHFSTQRTNKSRRCFNEFERIFDSPKEFTESANRRPPDWEDRLAALEEKVDAETSASGD